MNYSIIGIILLSIYVFIKNKEILKYIYIFLNFGRINTF